jgi:hypothetical protein
MSEWRLSRAWLLARTQICRTTLNAAVARIRCADGVERDIEFVDQPVLPYC